jgi:hypothetical protein
MVSGIEKTRSSKPPKDDWLGSDHDDGPIEMPMQKYSYWLRKSRENLLLHFIPFC